jgi:4-hydroxy-tetrahydrodipicolinate synthase
MSNNKSSRIRGVLAPVVTPFHADLSVNAEAFIAHCSWLLESGAGLAIFGTNSEANSLSVSERIQLTEALVQAGLPASSMMPGTGASSLTDAVVLTRHAVKLGAAGALMLPPFFYKNLSDDGLFAFYSEVIERVGDDRLQLYLYHIPAMSGVPITLNLIERLFKRYPKTIAGVKDSSGDWNNIKAMLDQFAADGLDIFPASEAFLSDALPLGAGGCISATANVNPRNIAELCARWQQPEAVALQERATVIRKIFQAQPMIPAMKQVIAHWGGDASWNVVRPPLMQVQEEAARNLVKQLQDVQFAMPGLPNK